MRRKSTTLEWFRDRRLIIDADGVEVDIPGRSEMDARLEAKASKVDTQNSLGDMVGLLAGWTADMRGGRNLLLNSDVNVTTRQYLVAAINQAPGHGLKDGDPFVITLKGQLGADRTQFIIFNSDSATQLRTLYSGTEDNNGVYTATGTWKVSGSNSHINVYAFPSTATSESTVEWVKIERGRRSTPWTPAPEDVATDIKAAGTTQSASPLVPIDHSLALRLDTTVGTRIFAGDTLLHGDTGFRTELEFDTSGIPSLGSIPAGWVAVSGVAGGIRWRRLGEEVFLYLRGLRASNASAQLSIPAGFSPSGMPFQLINVTSAEGLVTAKIGASQVFITASKGGVAFPDATGTYWSVATWRTKATWPTTLPGLPA